MLIVIGGVWLLGLILGLTKVITVYRDFNDVGLVGLTVALPVAVMMSLLGVGVQKFDFLLTPFRRFEAAMALLILVRTFVDNRNPLKAILAFLVKIPIGVLFAVNVVDYFTANRRQDRRLAGFFILLLSGFTIALVANKRGFLASDRLLRRHGVSTR